MREAKFQQTLFRPKGHLLPRGEGLRGLSSAGLDCYSEGSGFYPNYAAKSCLQTTNPTRHTIVLAHMSPSLDNSPPDKASRQPALAAYLLGPVEFESALALQQRLVFEASAADHRQITLLVCEHPPLVTIGRQGSRGDVALDAEALDRKKLAIRWVNRGGGTILHLPGQLAIYPIVPLGTLGWTPGEYLERLHAGLVASLGELGLNPAVRPDRAGLWGRTGLLCSVGVAIKTGVSYFGAYLNVEPTMAWVRQVATDPISHQPMSSLAVERRHAPRMTQVRESVVRQLAAAFEIERFHVFSRHPLLVRQTISVHKESSARAG